MCGSCPKNALPLAARQAGDGKFLCGVNGLAENLNEIIDKAPQGSVLTLPAGEFEGPVLIGKPLHIIGKDTTVWAKSGAVITVNSGGVTLENLRVELTEGSLDDIALLSNYPACAKNVEVLGKVRGFGFADGFFDVPRAIELGAFAAEERNTYLMTVNVPERVEIVCGMRDVRFSPDILEPGRNTVTITVSNIAAHTLLYTEVLLRSTFTRRIYLSGKPASDIPAASEKPLYTAPERSENSARQPTPAPATDVISISRPQPAQSPNQKIALRRGQRVSLRQYIGTRFSVLFTGNVPNGWEVDPYVFVVDQSGKAMDDTGLVFFGNEHSPNGEVVYSPQNGRVDIDLAKADSRIAKIVLAYSIYAGSAGKTFAGIKTPCVRLRDAEERVVFSLEGLSSEITVVALEFYLYKGEWKISAVGSGYNDGMARLCNYYGLEVI